MQAGGDLENAWLMFDHVKRVQSWTTMVYHVYDATFCRVMTIAICNMQSEDTAAQIVVWKNLNVVMARHNVSQPNFKEFMTDSAQTNWNAIRIVYGNGDASMPWTTRREHASFTRLSPSRSTQRPTLDSTFKINTDCFTSNTRTP
jgi:hypothetical protein